MRNLNWKLATSLLNRTTLRALMLGALLVGGGATVLTSCDAADNFFDCQAVCTKYHDCFDTGYNIGACRDRCRSNSQADSSYEQKANLCEACIDGKSCAGSFACTTECAGVVPN